MDKEVASLLLFIPLLLIVKLLGVFIIFIISSINKRIYKYSRKKKEILISSKKDLFKSMYGRETVFLCDSLEEIDDNVVEIRGESYNTPVCPGMKVIINDVGHIIKEVYADDKTPYDPDTEAFAGVPNTPIVIEKSGWDWISVQQNLKRDKIIPFKIR